MHIDDELKHLPNTVIEYPLRSPRRPLKIDGNLVLEQGAIHAEIEALGHVIVSGSAERCRLASEMGSVCLIRGSAEHTRIKAGKNIHVQSAVSSSLSADGEIAVDGSLLQCASRAGTRVVSQGTDGWIAGGRVEARNEVHVPRIGNPEGTPTELVVTSSKGVVAFGEIFPGVRLQIGSYTAEVTSRLSDGYAAAEGGRISFGARAAT